MKNRAAENIIANTTKLLKEKLNYSGYKEIIPSDELKYKLLIYPIEGLQFTNEDFMIFKKFCKEVGVKKIIWREIEGEENGEIVESSDRYIVSNLDEIEYKDFESYFVLENIIYSEKLDWFIFFNNELFGEFCGTKEKVDIFKKFFSSWKNNVFKFQDFELNYIDDFFENPKEYLLKEAKDLWENETELTEEEKYEWIYKKYGK